MARRVSEAWTIAKARSIPGASNTRGHRSNAVSMDSEPRVKLAGVESEHPVRLPFLGQLKKRRVSWRSSMNAKL
jgi:hypothetical protein